MARVVTSAADERASSVGSAVRRAMERPLASYQLLLGACGLLLGLGLIMVLSASSVLSHRVYGNQFSIVERQLLFAAAGLIGGFVVMRMPLTAIRKLIPFGLFLSIVLVAATLVPGIGVEQGGNRNWLPITASFQLQPSEFAKLALVLWTADVLARKSKKLKNPREILIPVLPVSALVAGLIIGQKDLGTASVLFVIVLGMAWIAGLPRKWMTALMLAVGVVSVFFVAIAPHRVARLFSFLNPAADPEYTGYQAIHAMMGFARGGFWGVGLGGSRQKWGSLPMAHTDFILAIIGEELGLAGTLVILVLFALIGVAGVRVATRCRDPFVRFAAAGITIWLLAQAVINIGMVLGLLPVIGIPLPLVSYGGSSLLATLLSLALLLKFATTEPGAQRALAANKRRRARRSAARKR